MADVTPYRVALLAQDYPTKYDSYLTFSQSFFTEVENARGAQSSVLANINYNFGQCIIALTGLTVDLNANSKRIKGGITPITSDEFVIKSYADGLAFS